MTMKQLFRQSLPKLNHLNNTNIFNKSIHFSDTVISFDDASFHIIIQMNPILLFCEVSLNCLLMPLWWVIGTIGYIYDYFACKKVPVPKKILVTGASSGIGKATAIEYAKEV